MKITITFEDNSQEIHEAKSIELGFIGHSLAISLKGPDSSYPKAGTCHKQYEYNIATVKKFEVIYK